MAARPDKGRVEIHFDECKGCLLCVTVCPTHVLQKQGKLNKQGYFPVEYTGSGCIGCGYCFYACPEPGAISVFRLKKQTA